MPPQVLEYNTQLAEAAHRLANAWHAADAKDEAAAEFSRDSTQMEEWSTDQVATQPSGMSAYDTKAGLWSEFWDCM